MSNLGDRLDDAINQFRALRDHAEWRNVQEESFLPALQGALNDAASQDALDSLASTVSGLPTEDTNLSASEVVSALVQQSILNEQDEVTANVDNQLTQSEELLLNQYATVEDAPAGSGPSIIGVTDDGHILVEDGQ